MSHAETAASGTTADGAAPLSPIVSDLLAIMEESGADIPAAAGTPAPLPVLSGDGLDKRAQLKDEFQKKYQAAPDGASRADADSLRAKRLLFTNALALDPRGAGSLDGMIQALSELAAEHARVVAAVKQVAAKRKQLTGALNDALPVGDPGALVEGATAEEAQPLFDERKRIADVLAPPKDGAPGVALSTLVAQRETIIKLSGDTIAFVSGVKAREALRKRLTQELTVTLPPGAAAPDDVVAGATPDDVAQMLLERDRIAQILRTARTTEPLNAEDGKIAALKQAKSKLADAVAVRQQRKAALGKAAADLVAALHAEADPTILGEEKAKVDRPLQRLPLADKDLDDADAALLRMRDTAASVRSDTLDRIARRTAFRSRVEAFRGLLNETADAGGDIELTTATSELEGLEAELDGDLWDVDFDGTGASDSMDDRLHNLRASLDAPMQAVLDRGEHGDEDKAAALVAYLTGAAAAVVAEAKRLQPFLDEDSTLAEGLSAQQTAVTNLLIPAAEEEPPQATGKKKGAAPAPKKNAQAKKAPSSQPALPDHSSIEEAFGIVTDMRLALDEARNDADGEAQTRAQLRDGLLARVEPADPGGLPPGYAVILQARRDAVSDPLGEEMSASVTDPVITAAKQAADLFERDLKAAEDIAKSWSASDKRFAAIRKAARQPLVGELDARRQAVLDAGQRAAGSSDFPGAVALCRALADLLTRTDGEAAKGKAAKDTLGTVRVGGDALDAKTVAEIYDLAGPDAIAGLPPDGLAILCSCFHKADAPVLANLRALVSEGFGAEGRVLAGLVRSGDKEGILALAAAFGGDGAKQDRANLRGLVVGGGLAEAPTVLDDLLSYGVRGAPGAEKAGMRSENVARIKSLGSSFGDADGPARMKTLVADCGLGQPRPETPPRPGAMAEVLHAGLDGDGKKLRGMADAFAGSDPAAETDRARLKGLVEEGGFGDRPKSLGPLVKTLVATGGVKGCTDKLKEVGREFKEDEDRQRLKKLLENGGMSGDTHDASGTEDPARKHEHADTLAKVFNEGLGGRALKLKDFAEAFGDTGGHAEECRHMLEAWNEFSEADKDSRKPGEKIKRLLSGGHFGDDVKRLQVDFTSRMEQIGGDGQRKKATRFGPHFDQADPGPNWQQPQPANNAATGVNTVIMTYILKRHVPKHAQRSMLAATNSYFPVDTTAAELAKIIGDAMAAPGAPASGGNATVPSNGMSVHIAKAADGNVPHCYPSAGPAPPDPKEIASFSAAEANLILDAVQP